MSLEILFYLLAGLSVITAIGVVGAKNPIHSVLSLIITFFLISGQYLIMNAQFLFIVNIIVYAGAIMVLFLFVLMLLNLNKDTEPQKSLKIKLISILAGGSLFLVLLASVISFIGQTKKTSLLQTDIGLVKPLGKILFTQYVVPFEIASILFIAAMVGAILIGKKKDQNQTTISNL